MIRSYVSVRNNGSILILISCCRKKIRRVNENRIIVSKNRRLLITVVNNGDIRKFIVRPCYFFFMTALLIFQGIDLDVPIGSVSHS